MHDDPRPTTAPRNAYASLLEAASYIRVSERTLRRLIRGNRLPSYRLGSRVLVAYEDLDALVRSSVVEAAKS